MRWSNATSADSARPQRIPLTGCVLIVDSRFERRARLRFTSAAVFFAACLSWRATSLRGPSRDFLAGALGRDFLAGSLGRDLLGPPYVSWPERLLCAEPFANFLAPLVIALNSAPATGTPEPRSSSPAPNAGGRVTAIRAARLRFSKMPSRSVDRSPFANVWRTPSR